MTTSHDRTSVFGTLAGGEAVEEVVLRRGRLSASIITLGAAISDLTVDGRSVTLGFNTLADYLGHSPHFGALAGRCANRIHEGRFMLDGREVQLSRNIGKHHLHGGFEGFGKRNWTLVETGPDHAVLELVSADGEEGYPGTVRVRCAYAIEGDTTLSIAITAETDAPTLVNIAPHAYFDLDRDDTILAHRLRLAADRFTVTDANYIPTGEIRRVEGTPYDFTVLRPIHEGDAASYRPVDHNFALAAAPSAEPRFAARLEGARSGLALDVWTTEPGLQVYDGLYLASVPVPVVDGRRLKAHAGICLEPQRFPDAANHPQFPGAVLRPGEVYFQRTEYRFSNVWAASKAGG